VRYGRAVELQERLRRGVLGGEGSEIVLLLEHDPVVTLGRATRPEHVLTSPEALAADGVEIAHTSRGGSATWHGPGQLVVYPIVQIGTRLRRHVDHLCSAAVDVLASLGLSSRYLCERPGVWLGDPPRKIASVGVHVHRGVAIHGLALNVAPRLDAFAALQPCGMSARVITSVESEGVTPPSLEALGFALAQALAVRMGRTLDPVSLPPGSVCGEEMPATPTISGENASSACLRLQLTQIECEKGGTFSRTGPG
jgi:lipoate-protein ligase B